MTNSTVPAESLGSPSPVSASYLWEVPNKAVSIQISLDVIDRIEREVIDSFKAITKRGSEVGGILLGRIAHAGKRTVFVENYESIPCDYARGPLYLLAEPDKERLQQALQRLKGSPLSVVGFFRGNTRKDLVLDEDDLALAQEFFSDSNHVFLLVKPFAMKPSTGAFFFWEDGKLQAESYLQFPFRRSELQKTPQSIVQAGGRAADAPPAPAREDRAPVIFPKREERPVPVFVKREEPRLGPVVVPPKREEPKREEPKREEPVVSAPPPRQDLPPVRVAAPPPPVSKREEPASPPAPAAPPIVSKKREERPPAVPLNFKREERPSIVPVSKREERPAPVLPKREDRPPITPVSLKRQEKPAVTPKKEEPPKRDERPAIQPVAKREEVATPPPPAAETGKKKEEPVAAAPISQATLAPAPAAAVDEAVAIPLPEAPAKRGAGRWIAIILIVLLAVAAGIYFGFIRGRQAPPAPVDTALNLRVERNAGQLVLTWNRNAPIIANSQKSMLSITDGDHQEDVELDPGTLRSGSIVYSPITNDVSFRLEVSGADGTPVSESVRALAGRPSPLQSAPPPTSETRTQPAATTPASTPAATQQPPAATQSSSAGQAQSTTSVAQTQPPPADEEPAPETRVTAAPPKPFSLAARLRPAEPRELAAPPEIAAGSSSGIAARLLPGQSTAVPPPPATPPPPAPKPNIRVGGVVEEAVVLQRTAPVYPPLARQARVSGVVRVEAVVGTDGRVVRATALSGPPLLRQAAVEAVQRWRYQPGRLNGQPVQVTTQVDVSFTLNR